MTNPKQPDSSLVEVVRAFIDEHCAGPNGGELTVCSSPSLVEWNSLRAALTAISPSLRAQRDAEIIQWLREEGVHPAWCWAKTSHVYCDRHEIARALESGEV